MLPPSWLSLLLGFLTAVGPLSTDMYLPGLPSIEVSFGAAPGSGQITLAAWLAGLALGQIAQGTLSDRFGRRGPLLAGMVLYLVATIGCATAPNMGVLAAWRVAAAVGGSAGMVIPRAMVRDYATGNRAARMMSQQMLIMGVAPILAPTLGGFLLDITGWRGIFWFQTGFGLIGLLLIVAFLPDSLAPEHRVRLDLARLLLRYRSILVERGFQAHTLVAAGMATAVFAYLGGAPVIYIQMYGLSPVQTGMIFGINGGCFVLITQLNGFIVHRFGTLRLLQIGVFLFAAAAFVVAFEAFTSFGGLWGIAIPITVMLAGTGMIAPNTAVGALMRHAHQAGSASALLGTLQYGTGAIGGAIVTVIADGSARPMGIMVVAAALLGLVGERLRPQRA